MQRGGWGGSREDVTCLKVWGRAAPGNGRGRSSRRGERQPGLRPVLCPVTSAWPQAGLGTAVSPGLGLACEHTRAGIGAASWYRAVTLRREELGWGG